MLVPSQPTSKLTERHMGWIGKIPRRAGVDGRVVGVGLAARFTDEVLSGLPDVLMPAIRSGLGLSYAEVGALRLVMDAVATVVEPVNGLLLDVWSRRWIMAAGAAIVGLAVVVMGAAGGFLALAAGFALYGLGSGPLAHTGDVVLVDAHPEAPERIFLRSNIVDTFGALLAPLIVMATAMLRIGWRTPLLVAGGLGIVYALVIATTRFPAPAAGQHEERAGEGLRQTLGRHLREVLAHAGARRWLAVLLALAVSDAGYVFLTVWLADVAGMSQAQVGLYQAMLMAVTLVAIVVLDRVVARVDAGRVLAGACIGLLLLYPAWLLAPGVAWRFVLGAPVAFLAAVPWPLARSRALAALPGRAGTVTAIQGLYGVLPTALLIGWGGEQVGLSVTMGAALWGGTAAMLALVGRS
jgi:fucose permease